MKISFDFSKVSLPQKRFFEAKKKYVGYGGARGGGKSWAVRQKAKLMALRYPGIKILIVRRTLVELRNNHIDPLTADLAGIARYNKQEKRFVLPNGSIIAFDYCDCDSDVSHYQGSEWDIIFIDEATNLLKEWIDKIVVCCRGTNSYVKRVYFTMNPGGPSHAHFKRLFLDRKFEKNENPNDYEFIQALVTDNKALLEAQPEYLAQLEALPPTLRAMWLEGRWDIAEGQFFEDFRIEPDLTAAHQHGVDLPAEVLRERHQWCHVIPPFNPPKHWTIYRGYDFGYNHPYSIGYWAIDEDGVMYRILEIYGCTAEPNTGTKETPEAQAKRVSEFERNHPWLKGRNIVGVADPAIWDASRGESIAETFQRYGIYFSPGDHERLAGWMQIHFRLQMDEMGYSRMYIFDNCEGFIRTMPMLMYDDHHPEDLDTSMEDHIADETRYVCMARPIKAIVPEIPKPSVSDPLDLMPKKKGRWTL